MSSRYSRTVSSTSEALRPRPLAKVLTFSSTRSSGSGLRTTTPRSHPVLQRRRGPEPSAAPPDDRPPRATGTVVRTPSGTGNFPGGGPANLVVLSAHGPSGPEGPARGFGNAARERGD